MKNNLRVKFIMLLLCSLILGCSSDDDDDLIGNWATASTFNGSARSGSAYFTIGDLGYMGTGFDGDDYLNDFWVYDMNTNSWQQKADFPGVARTLSTGFAINNLGYVGTGYNGDSNTYFSDFYSYNPSTNTWTQIEDFAYGLERREAVSFSSNSTGYVGTGFDGDNDKKDFWKYNPADNTWMEVIGFSGNKRRGATSFKINNIVYIVTGVSNGVYQNDFYGFDLDNETWINSLYDIDADDDDDPGFNDDYTIIRSGAVGFTIAGKGYIACGESFGPLRSVWEYDANRDIWDEKTGFELTGRQNAIAFYNDNRAFVSLGRSGTLYLDDTMEFFPSQEQDDDDN